MLGPTRARSVLICLSAFLCVFAQAPTVALAEDPPAETVAAASASLSHIETLPSPAGRHWVWVTDFVFRHSILFDADSGRVLGMIDSAGPLTTKPPYLGLARGEIYSVDSVRTRAYRGERTDLVTIFDASTLNVSGEVVVPPRTADTGQTIALAAVLDGARFVVLANQIPGSSVTVIDLQKREVTAEIQTAGCSGVYATGPTSFATVCGDGTVLGIMLDANGMESESAGTQSFFSSVDDPVTLSAVRTGSDWLFVSFEGFVHSVSFKDGRPKVADRWSLFDEEERAASWRIGGFQHLALHRAEGRLYSLVHIGGAGSHKDPGTEIWVYDIATHERVARFDAPGTLPAFLRPYADLEPDSFAYKVLGWLLPNAGVHSIAVTQDDEPVLLARHGDIGAVAVLDAHTGDRLRDLDEAGIAGRVLTVHE